MGPVTHVTHPKLTNWPIDQWPVDHLILFQHQISLSIRNKGKMWQVRPCSGTAVYPHMPILRPHRCDILPDAGVAGALADSSDFGLLGEQSSQKCEIPCSGRRWTVVQNLTPMALSLAEKSVAVQTNKQTNSKQYINTLPIGMCG